MDLSVSSVGSSPLQRSRGHVMRRRLAESFSILGRIEPTATFEQHCRAVLSICNFQYPRSDRAHCNRITRWEWKDVPPSFSILGRIEPTATCPVRLQPPDRVIFQYPRSDRAHCNSSKSRSSQEVDMAFQYPRSDRAHCNSWTGLSLDRSKTTFSILGRIEPTATLHGGPAGGTGAANLSVSSVGSSPLQRRWRRLRARGGWTLSVSSVGSSPLQRWAVSGVKSTPLTFSILGRIEPTATSLTTHFPAGGTPFQYPRSDRAHCNPRASLSPSKPPWTFSILGRIEPTATPPPIHLGAARTGDLSVSSVGSSPLQPALRLLTFFTRSQARTAQVHI